MALLRAVLQIKELWITDHGSGQSANGTASAHEPKRPKTRDAILSYLETPPQHAHTVREIRAHLGGLGIKISPEGIRQALRRLQAEDKVIAGKVPDGTSYYQFRSSGSGGDQE